MQIGRLAAEQATEPVMAGEGEVSEEAERLGVQRRPRVEDEEGRDSSRLPCPQEVLSTERERALGDGDGVASVECHCDALLEL